MKWLRECVAEYASHPLPTFIGLAIIAASLTMAAMAFITRHAVSQPSVPLAGAAQSARPAAPSLRHTRPSLPPQPLSPARPVPAPVSAAPQIQAAGHLHVGGRHHTHPQSRQHDGPPHGRKDHHPRHHPGSEGVTSRHGGQP